MTQWKSGSKEAQEYKARLERRKKERIAREKERHHQAQIRYLQRLQSGELNDKSPTRKKRETIQKPFIRHLSIFTMTGVVTFQKENVLMISVGDGKENKLKLTGHRIKQNLVGTRIYCSGCIEKNRLVVENLMAFEPRDGKVIYSIVERLAYAEDHKK